MKRRHPLRGCKTFHIDNRSIGVATTTVLKRCLEKMLRRTMVNPKVLKPLKISRWRIFYKSMAILYRVIFGEMSYHTDMTEIVKYDGAVILTLKLRSPKISRWRILYTSMVFRQFYSNNQQCQLVSFVMVGWYTKSPLFFLRYTLVGVLKWMERTLLKIDKGSHFITYINKYWHATTQKGWLLAYHELRHLTVGIIE